MREISEVTKLRLEARLQNINKVLDEVGKKMEEARGHGDLRENEEYTSSLETYTKLSRDKIQIESILESAKIVKSYPNSISVGTLLSVKIIYPDGTVSDEGLQMFDDKGSGFFDGTISPDSPLGRAIYGTVGGEFKVQALNGSELTYIVNIEPKERIKEYLELYPPDRNEMLRRVFPS